MDKFKKFFIFFLCLCISFFPLVFSLNVNAADNVLSTGINISGFTFDNSNVVMLSDFYNFNMVDMGYTKGLNETDFSNSSIYSPDMGNTFYTDNLTNICYQLFDGISSNKELCFPSVFSYNGNEYNLSDYPYFLVSCSGYQTIIYFFDFNPNDINYVYKGFTNGSSSSYSGNYLTFKGYLSQVSDNFNPSFTSFSAYDSMNTPSYATTYKCMVSNWDGVYDQPSGSTNVGNPGSSNNITYMNNCFNNSNKVKLNYMLYDSEGNFNYSNPIINGSSSETSSNNLYMDGAKWSFDIPYYSLDQSGATYGTGTATFSGSLNEFQISNTSDFTLEFLFTSFLTGYRYSWAQDSEREDFGYKYIYSTEIPLSDFYSNGQVASFNISDIFDNSISVNPTHLGQSITEDCQVISNSQAVNLSNWYTTFTVALKSNDEYSGKCSSMYSYLLRKSKNTDNSMQTNSNPYTGEEGSNSVPDSDIFNGESAGSSAGNSNSTSNIGDYSVVNNNNPHITINNNNDNGFTNAIENGDSDGLLSKLLLLLANNQSTTSTGISEIADTDGYVQVMGSVFTAVPAAWWTTLTVAFVACIGILVVSFVIKIILKFVI